MRSLLAVSAALLALSGCTFPCGSYSVESGMELDGVALDREDYFEACGASSGEDGSFDLLGDGFAWFTLTPEHAEKDVDWAAILVDLEVRLPNAQLVAGTRVADVTGDARVVDFAGNHHAIAGLASATIDVLAVDEADEPCTPFRAQKFELEWDIEWGTAGSGAHYTAVGKDWISLFLDESSSDEGCP